MILIDGYPIDIAVTEAHVQKSRPTSHPIERSSNTSDHIIDEPDTFTLECLVTNSPIGQIENLRFLEDGKPSDNVYAKLQAIRDGKKVHTVTTALKVYLDVVLTDLSIPINSKTGDAIRFTASWQKFTFVDNERVFIQVASPSGSKNNNRGNKASKKPPDAPADAAADENSSTLWKLTH